MANPWETPLGRAQEQRFAEFNRSDLQALSRDYQAGRLPLNIAEMLLKHVDVIHTKGWSSKANPELYKMHVGMEAVPKGTVTRWGWGVHEAVDQASMKISHESAHFIQHFFEPALVSYLEDVRIRSKGKAESLKDFYQAGLEGFLEECLIRIPESSRDYLKLHLFLEKTGRVSGLPDEDIYKEQTEDQQSRGSLLDMRTYEDAAEMIGAWMLGEKYYNFRLDQSKTPLTIEQKAHLTELIEKVFTLWVTQRSKRP